jgi:hypothetical protein
MAKNAAGQLAGATMMTMIDIRRQPPSWNEGPDRSESTDPA